MKGNTLLSENWEKRKKNVNHYDVWSSTGQNMSKCCHDFGIDTPSLSNLPKHGGKLDPRTCRCFLKPPPVLVRFEPERLERCELHVFSWSLTRRSPAVAAFSSHCRTLASKSASAAMPRLHVLRWKLLCYKSFPPRSYFHLLHFSHLPAGWSKVGLLSVAEAFPLEQGHGAIARTASLQAPRTKAFAKDPKLRLRAEQHQPSPNYRRSSLQPGIFHSRRIFWTTQTNMHLLLPVLK